MRTTYCNISYVRAHTVYLSVFQSFTTNTDVYRIERVVL
jgi:hypothetical protein